VTARLLLPGLGSITADCFACGPTDLAGGRPAYVPGGLVMTELREATGRPVAGNGVTTRHGLRARRATCCAMTAEETPASGGLPMLPAELPTCGIVPGDAGSNAP